MSQLDLDVDDGYDSVGEEAELELSCALHDLAERVKSFEENMRGRLRTPGALGDYDDSDDEEIGEDIPEVDDSEETMGRSNRYGYASPKKRATAHRGTRRHGRKGTKQHDDDDEDEDGGLASAEEDDGDDSDDAEDAYEKKRTTSKYQAPTSTNNSMEWDEEHDKDELCGLKNSIAMLLRGITEEAKALEAAKNNQ